VSVIGPHSNSAQIVYVPRPRPDHNGRIEESASDAHPPGVRRLLPGAVWLLDPSVGESGAGPHFPVSTDPVSNSIPRPAVCVRPVDSDAVRDPLCCEIGCRSPRGARGNPSASDGKSIAETRAPGHAANEGLDVPPGTLGKDVRFFDASSGAFLSATRLDSAPLDLEFDPATGAIVGAAEDGTAWISRCEVCVPLKELLALAEARVTRDLTTKERATYLHGS
jgi:hypothetical protein